MIPVTILRRKNQFLISGGQLMQRQSAIDRLDREIRCLCSDSSFVRLGVHIDAPPRLANCIMPLMLADKLQDMAVENLGLLPVDRVRSLGQDDELGAGDTGKLAAHDPGRTLQVLITGHQ